MRKFGLIGYPLSHSFSERYFTEKFKKEGIKDAVYQLFPLDSIQKLPDLLAANPDLAGLNVTIPYKEEVIPFLNDLDDKAKSIGAVNTITIKNGKLKGYNTDYYGFKESFVSWVGAHVMPENALLLGTGGASKAVKAFLEDLGIEYKFISREPNKDQLSYDQLNELQIVNSSKLIINTTPLGMSPKSETLPDLPYDQITQNHFLFDLVYNPLVTAFMKAGIEKKCWVKNGLEMLHGQAEKAWEIWNR